EAAGEQRGYEKGNAKPQRVGCQQQSAFADRFAPSGQRQYGAQHRTDAGRPAKSEGEPHYIGRRIAGGSPATLETSLPRQQGNLQDSEKVQPHENDENARDKGERFLPHPQEAADRRGAGSECNENGRESQDESD